MRRRLIISSFQGLEFSEETGAAFSAQQAPGFDGAEIDGGIDAGRLASTKAARPALSDAESLGGAVQADFEAQVGNPAVDDLTADASRGIGTVCRGHYTHSFACCGTCRAEDAERLAAGITCGGTSPPPERAAEEATARMGFAPPGLFTLGLRRDRKKGEAR